MSRYIHHGYIYKKVVFIPSNVEFGVSPKNMLMRKSLWYNVVMSLLIPKVFNNE